MTDEPIPPTLTGYDYPEHIGRDPNPTPEAIAAWQPWAEDAPRAQTVVEGETTA